MNGSLSFLVPANPKDRAAGLRGKRPPHRPPLTLEALEDRTVPSAVPVIGNLPVAPVVGNQPALASPLPAPIASAAPAAASPAATGTAAALRRADPTTAPGATPQEGTCNMQQP
jgi:hypothetical protein